MALIKLSSVGITALSGKAGGSVYSHNRGGAYIRNFAVPSNPQTALQQAARQAFGAISSMWRTLTVEERSSWEARNVDFPRSNVFGDARVLSGFSLHQSLNRNLGVINIAPITTAPVPAAVGTTTNYALSMTNTAGVLSITSSGGASPVDDQVTRYALYLTPPMSPGITYAKNRYRLVGVSGDDVLPIASSLPADYTALFGVPPAGSKVMGELVPIGAATGQRASGSLISLIVQEGV